MTHTEGNWKAFTDNANGFGVTNGNTVIAIAGEDDLPENEANANLIASAPEMLEALLQINNLELDGSFGDHKIALLDWAKKVGKIARRAIAKAEGKEEESKDD
jgi:hypothetical protein